MSGRKSAGPGRRAVLRWAWRMFRREWRQQLLVLSLITLAVAAAVALATVSVEGSKMSNGDFGEASALIKLDSTDPVKAQIGVAAAKRRFGAVEVIEHAEVPVPGSVEKLDVRSMSQQGRFSRRLLALRAGRYPAAANEIGLTKGAAALFGVQVGDHVAVGGVARTLVGLVENPSDLHDEFALLAPGSGFVPESLTVLTKFREMSAAHRITNGDSGPDVPLMVQGASNNDGAVAATVLITTTLAMALVALIASAGFVVVAQRRQRQLGLLGALGATERHLRLVMLANGAIVGVVAAVVGGALGVLGWIAAAPAVESAVAHRLDRFALPWTLIAQCLGLAVVAATAAAWWPARTMARLPVMAALSRRPARPSPVHRSLALALGLVAAGVGAIVAAHPTAPHVRPLFLIGGLLAVVVGAVLAAPAAVRALAVPARRMPFATRLALRDLVRYQARAAAALAAITLALGISVAIIVTAQAEMYRSDEGNLSSRELLIRSDDQFGPVKIRTQAEHDALDEHATAIAATLGNASVVGLDEAFNPRFNQNPDLHQSVDAAAPLKNGFRFVAKAYIATPALLNAVGIDPSDVRPSTELITSVKGKVVLLDIVNRARTVPQTKVQRMDLSKFTSAPNSLITERAMKAQGWVAERSAWLIESPIALTSSQTATARKAAADAGLTIEARSTQDDVAALRTGATAVGALLALAIVAMTLGLLRGESVRDLRTLTETGAPARIRRALTASTAGALALLGVVLSVVGAYAALVAGYHSELGKLVPLPYANLLVLAVGLPAIAAAGGWLFGGREPQAYSRQAMD